MPAPSAQAEVAAFLRDLAVADPIETHISLVFLGRDTVWKLKKAVRLPFLDFTTPAARRRFTTRELELNRPAAPALYRDVVSVVRRIDGRLAFGAPGDAAAIDWVLRMARVPSEDFLDQVAAAGRLTPQLLDALGDTVAEFHSRLPPMRDTDVVAAMRRVILGNAQSACNAGLPKGAVRDWQAGIGTALDGLSPWLTERERDGFVRRAHGDLHLGNLCLWQDHPVPFDALEFDEAMATIDLGYDLAFLLMDLDQRVSRTAANRVLNRYVARNGDAPLTRGLPAFLSLRAMVRAHVEAKRGKAAIASSYLTAATDYLQPAQPVMVAIGGLPGTGKTTLARTLAPELGRAPGALVLRSDEIRKRQHGAPPEQRLPQSAYSDAAGEAVMAELANLAGRVAVAGHAVIADATFIDPRHRRMLSAAGRSANVRFVGIWLQAPLPELEARISARQSDASDATVAVLRAASRTDPGPGGWIAVDATEPTSTAAHARRAIPDH